MAATGILRIRYKGRETVFDYGGMRQRDVPEKIREHLVNWSRETVNIDGLPTVRLIPVEDVIAEWVTDQGKPTETVTPVPVQPSA